MDWDDLRVVLAVAREGSFSRAAEALRVTQPTVGRRMAALEADLGARVFEPGPQGQQLTEAGEQLRWHAEQMEAAALAAESATRGRDRGVRGVVRITASEWLLERVLAPGVAPLLRAHAGLELDLVADPRHLNLARRDADIAVRPSRFGQAEVVESAVGALAFGLYASEGYLARHGVPDFSRQCRGHLLVAMGPELTQVPDVAWLPGVASQARVAARANGRLPMARLVAAGAGMAVLPRILGDDTPGLRLLVPPTPAPVRTLWLAAHRRARAIPRVRATLDHLRQLLRSHLPAVEEARA